MKRLSFIVIALLVLALVTGAYAATDIFEAGKWKIDSNNTLIPASGASAKAIYELAATNDTLDATDSGKLFAVKLALATSTDTVTFTLPTAAVGLVYDFVVADDIYVSLDSASTDTFIYKNPPMKAGTILYNSTKATGDSVRIFCPVANYWAVQINNGTWTEDP